MSDIQLSREHIERLRALGVSALYLFGSRAQGVAAPQSDFDFAVLMRDPSIVKFGRNTLPLYQQLYDLLTDVIPSIGMNPVVDIVFLQGGVSLELQANVVKHGRLLLDDDPRQRADYESQVMIRMADFKPVLNMIDQSILASLV